LSSDREGSCSLRSPSSVGVKAEVDIILFS
jgi:hypothetical protein